MLVVIRHQNAACSDSIDGFNTVAWGSVATVFGVTGRARRLFLQDGQPDRGVADRSGVVQQQLVLGIQGNRARKEPVHRIHDPPLRFVNPSTHGSDLPSHLLNVWWLGRLREGQKVPTGSQRLAHCLTPRLPLRLIQTFEQPLAVGDDPVGGGPESMDRKRKATRIGAGGQECRIAGQCDLTLSQSWFCALVSAPSIGRLQ